MSFDVLPHSAQPNATLNWREELPYFRARAIVVTKHGKEWAIAPHLRQGLGLVVETSMDIDTDRFGTFTGDMERRGGAIDAARAKIAAGFAACPDVRIGIASEGSFGPHPLLPFVAVGRELVLMVDRQSSDEWVGQDVSPQTNFSTSTITDLRGARAFAERAGFPDHNVIVTAGFNGHPAPALAITKDFKSLAEFDEAVEAIIDQFGSACLQTDMRASRNPTRMRAVDRAAADLIRRFRSRCPACHYPGYDVREWMAGLPCRDCGEPTKVVHTHVLRCTACDFAEQRLVSEGTVTEPGNCGSCNP